MNRELAESLDLGLAWRRTQGDAGYYNFVRHPFETDLIETDLENWLNSIRTEISDGRFSPGSHVLIDALKPNGAIRPGSYLRPRDRLAYTSLVGMAFPHIQAALTWAQNEVDFSYLLSEDSGDVNWIRDSMRGWRRFETSTLAMIESGVTHVLFTDITGYYENISLEILSSDLRQLGVPDMVASGLSMLLNRWAQSAGRSLPQGHSASDILAKVYLNPVDELLRSQGISHVRYVDDFRVFARSRSEAKQALLQLTRHLRQRGLSLQTAKTKIVDVVEAREHIEELTRLIREVRQEFLTRARSVFLLSEYPRALSEVESLIDDADDINETPIVVIRAAFENHFVANYERSRFNKSLFHFLLNRLRHVGDDYAAERCLQLLVDQPQETSSILTYLQQCPTLARWDNHLALFLDSNEAIYHHQNYLILERRFREDTRLPDTLVARCREYAFDNNYPSYLRSIARAHLGRNGAIADLEHFLQLYGEASSDLEQAELVCCLARLERNRRNTFAARVRQDNPLNRLASQRIRNL